MPATSVTPQAVGQLAPLKLQRTAVSGWPALAIVARKACVAPSSTLALGGARVMATSLATVICAAADFVASAWLVAVTLTVAGEGKSAGAVNTPLALIVPVVAEPPATPFTFHVTLVLVVLLTVAVNVCELPSNIVALVGETDTLIAGGGGVGGGGGVTVPPGPALAQPSKTWLIPPSSSKESAPWSALAKCGSRFFRRESCARGRMPGGMQAKGQRKEIKACQEHKLGRETRAA